MLLVLILKLDYVIGIRKGQVKCFLFTNVSLTRHLHRGDRDCVCGVMFKVILHYFPPAQLKAENFSFTRLFPSLWSSEVARLTTRWRSLTDWLLMHLRLTLTMFVIFGFFTPLLLHAFTIFYRFLAITLTFFHKSNQTSTNFCPRVRMVVQFEVDSAIRIPPND